MPAVSPLRKIIANVFVDVFKLVSIPWERQASAPSSGVGLGIRSTWHWKSRPDGRRSRHFNAARPHFSRREKPSFLLIGIFVLSAYSLSAIDHVGLAKARQLEKDKRYEEAIAVYESLSDKATDEKDDQLYMLAAVNIARSSMNNQEKAVKLAGRVKNPERRAFVQMFLFKPEEIVAKYKDTDFMTWPDDIRAEALKNRGSAYNSLKKYKEALADFEKAFAVPGGSNMVRGVAANTAGDIYLSNMKDEAKAAEMYHNALSVTKAGYAWRNDSLLKLTEILLKNKKNQEALALYEGVDTKKIEILTWKIALARGYSKALAANGEKLKALEQLNIALQAETKPETKKLIQADIDKLTEDML